jgi:hypothetical protein
LKQRQVIKSNQDQHETASHFGELGMNGIEQLRAFILSGKRAGMAVSLAFQLVEVGDGFAAFEGVPGLHAYNPLGTVHGGYAATLWTLRAVARFIPSSPPAIVTPPSNLKLRITRRSVKKPAKSARKAGF